MVSFKRKLSFKIQTKWFYKYLVLINVLIFHMDLRQKKVSYGNLNNDKTFYVIRSTSTTEGILSIYLNVLKKINECKSKGFIPIVDYENYINQYTLGEINGTKNTWNYFFEEINKYDLEEVYNSKNVILSGWTIDSILCDKKKKSFNEELNTLKTSIEKIYKVNPFLENIVINKEKRYLTNNTLGLYLRGTDYTNLKPKGHYVQPSLSQVIKKINDFILNYKIDKILLVTEDLNIKNYIADNVDIEVVYISKEVMFSKINYISESINKNDLLDNTIDYITNIILLSRCRYLISSITNATFFLELMTINSERIRYYFDLGVY